MSRSLRIEALELEAFGQFRRFRLELGRGLNLLFGVNEAGKSTLLHFVRAVLFGFESRKSARRYEPEGAGAWGGQLVLGTAGGSLVLRRSGGRRAEGDLVLRGKDGAALSVEQLDELLGGVTRELFYEVFAFGLDELASFERLAKEGGVAEALFSAGMEGAEGYRGAVSILDKGCEELFAPRGQRPLNALFADASLLQRRWVELGDRPEEYAKVKARLEALEGGLQEAERRLACRSADREELARVRSALDSLRELSALEAELAEDPSLSSFPVGAAPRLEDLQVRLERSRAVEHETCSRLEATEGQLSALGPTGNGEALERGRQALASFNARAELALGLEGRRARLAERTRQAHEAAARLGLPGGLEAVDRLDFGAAAKARLVAFRDELERTRRRQDAHADQLERLRFGQERNAALVARLSASLGQLDRPAAAQVREQLEAAERLAPLSEQLDQALVRLREQTEAREAHVAEPEAPLVDSMPWWSLLAAGVVLGLGALASGLGGPAYVAAAVLGLGLVVLYLRLGRSARAQREAFKHRQEARERELARLEGSLEQWRARAERLKGELAEEAARAGFEGGGHRATHELVRALQGVLVEAERGERLGEELEVARVEQTRLADELGARQREHEQLGELAQGQREGLDAFLRPYGLAGAHPQAALDLFQEASVAKGQGGECALEARALEVDERACAEVASAIEGALEGLGASSDVADVHQRATRLGALLEAEAERAARAQAASERGAELRRALEGERRAQRALTAELEALLSRGGVSNVTEFRERAERKARFDEAVVQRRELVARAEASSGHPLGELRRRVAELGGAVGVTQRAAELEESWSEAVVERRGLGEERGALLERLAALSTEAEQTDLRRQYEAKATDAARQARKYAVQRLALLLLERARTRFEREHKPRLVQRAEELFRDLTAGRYRHVFSPVGTRELRLVDSGGSEWSSEQLSRGTRELLYLAFRLAVVEDFGARRVALPILLDDILVNFDPERSRRVVAVLSRLAERGQQVVAFSCHPSVRELFKSEGARVQEIQGKQLTLMSA